ncbi:MAG: hypothetical protein Q9218_005049 [Villophora microphyllina]
MSNISSSDAPGQPTTSELRSKIRRLEINLDAANDKASSQSRTILHLETLVKQQAEENARQAVQISSLATKNASLATKNGTLEWKLTACDPALSRGVLDKLAEENTRNTRLQSKLADVEKCMQVALKQNQKAFEAVGSILGKDAPSSVDPVKKRKHSVRLITPRVDKEANMEPKTSEDRLTSPDHQRATSTLQSITDRGSAAATGSTPTSAPTWLPTFVPAPSLLQAMGRKGSWSDDDIHKSSEKGLPAKRPRFGEDYDSTCQ